MTPARRVLTHEPPPPESKKHRKRKDSETLPELKTKQKTPSLIYDVVIIYFLIIKGPQVPCWGASFILYAKKKKEKKERKKKERGEREKKIIPKYNKRRTVSADFHLHKFSYILVKIIAGAEECSGSVEAEERKCSAAEEQEPEQRVTGGRTVPPRGGLSSQDTR